MTDPYKAGLDHIRAGRYFEAHEDLELVWRGAPAEERDFYQRLAATVGELVGAGKVLFWRLRDDSLLAPLAAGSFGVDRAFLSRLKPTPCVPGGDELAVEAFS